MNQVQTTFFILLTLFSVKYSQSLAQDDRAKLDSLLKVVKVTESPIARISLLHDISEKYMSFNRDSAKLYAEMGLKIVQAQPGSLWIARFSSQLSDSYFEKKDYAKATSYAEAALSIFKNQNQPAEVSKSYFQLGKSLIFLGENAKADSALKQSIETARSHNDTINLGLAYSCYAYFYYYQHDFKQALAYYEKSQELLAHAQKEHLATIASNANFIGSIHFYNGDMFKALDSYQKSYETFSKMGYKAGIAYALNNIGLVYQEVEYFDKALELHMQALEIRKELKDSLEIAYSLFDIGQFYLKQGQYKKALQVFLEGLNICQKIEDNGFNNKFLAAIAEIYGERGDISKARKYLDQSKQSENPIIELRLVSSKLLMLEKRWSEAALIALNVFNAAESKDFIQFKNKAAEYLITCYAELGQYQKALEFSFAKQQLTDSLNNYQNAKLTRRLAFEFDSERKEAELSSLTKQNQLQQNKMDKQRYMIYVFVLLGLLAILAAAGFYYLSQKNKQLAAKESELRTATLNLFANISHELRTPLSIIRIPLEQMLSGRFNGDLTQARQQMLGNVQRLTDLVDQILEISRTKENQLQLNLQYENPLEFLRVFVGQFGSYANHKNLVLELKIPIQPLAIRFDEEIWSKILNNLINNALKFTEKGSVTVEFSYKNEIVELKIKDTGNGIPAEYLPHIFKRYYRSPLEKHQNFTGGLGLTLVNELVNLYKGKIEVESELGKGTIFTIELPHNEHFETSELPTDFQVFILSQNPQSTDVQPNTFASMPLEAISPVSHSHQQAGNLKRLLIIEDNIELNGMIANYLSSQFRVFQAFDGVEGFEVAQKVIPDLILTDVMMPRMDGIDLANMLHQSPETSHIPLIIISALKDELLDKTFWKAGVVDFIQKPLDMERLSSKIASLIAGRERFKSQIQKNSWIELSADVPVTDSDKEFLERFQQVLKENMDTENMDIEKLSQLMLVSRMQLFRKVKSLTGMTPEKFIQKVKMQYAFELLRDKKMENVTEVAASIGYTNLSFFSRKFKEFHGINATDVIKSK
ncbi:MAG: tetratricopeptide repeat protein [Bacteroidetes bacterium]|nr:tetratricopeptide repeat protein [Bacteroidota bacterium]